MIKKIDKRIEEQNDGVKLTKMAFATLAKLNEFWVGNKDKNMSFNEFMDIQHSTFKEYFPMVRDTSKCKK